MSLPFPLICRRFVSRLRVVCARRLLASVFLLPVAATAAIYHVAPTGDDTAAGTAAAPWATLTKANATLVAGDTVIIHAGTYGGQRIEPANSGRPGKYLTYRGAPGEAMPVLTAPPSMPDLADPGLDDRRVSIVLNEKHHVWIEGVKVSGLAPRPPLGPDANLESWAILCNADYNVIQNCVFEYARGWKGMQLYGARGSNFNRIHGNTLRVTGTFDNGKDPKGPVMSADVFSIDSASHHNWVEGNDMRYGGHNVVEIIGSRNLVRGNRFDNNWGAIGGKRADGTEIGYRVGTLSAVGRSVEAVTGVGFNLIEDNIVTGARQTKYPESRYLNPPAFKVEGNGQIVRRNLFIDNQFDVCSTVIRDNGVPLSRNNHIYNNTFAGNGGAVWRVMNYENDATRLDHNVFMNNLACDNRRNPAFAQPGSDRDVDLSLSSKQLDGAVVARNRVFGNALFNAGDGLATVLVQGVGRRPLAWYETPANGYGTNFAGNRQIEPRWVAAMGDRDSREEFDLAPDSPLIDAGELLTQTAAVAGKNLTVVPVADAGYFFPGIPELGVPGDLVRIGPNAPVRVTAVDLATNALTLAAPVSWTGGPVGVSLDYEGRRPDIGAREFSVRPTPP